MVSGALIDFEVSSLTGNKIFPKAQRLNVHYLCSHSKL